MTPDKRISLEVRIENWRKACAVAKAQNVPPSWYENAGADFLKIEHEASYQEGLREQAIRLDKNFAEWLKGTDTDSKEVLDAIRKETREATVREVVEMIKAMDADEIKGFDYHFVTIPKADILSRLESLKESK